MITEEKVLTKLPISKDLAYVLEERRKGYKIPIISDRMFHTMLNNESKKKYVSYLISLALDKPYEEILNSIKFLKNKLDKEYEIETNKTVDLLCKINDEYINIEMNNNQTPEVLERNISYATRIHSNRKRGNIYNYNRVIQININNFSYEGIEEPIQKFMLKEETDKYLLTDKLTFIQIYLPKIRKKYYNKTNLTDLEKLLLVFNENNDSNLKEIVKGNEIMEEYVSDAIEASEDDILMGLVYDKEIHEKMLHNSELEYVKKQGIEEGMKQGIQQGIEKGIKQNKIETAKKLLENNVDIGIIASSTGLTVQEIRNIP